MREVKISVQGLSNALVTSKLLAVIGSERIIDVRSGVRVTREPPLRLHRLPLFGPWKSVIDATYAPSARQWPATDNRIEFPVSETLMARHNCGTFLDRNAVRELPTALMGAIALFPLLLAARAQVESSATALILEDVLVAPFVTYSWVILFLEPKANLFRAPVLV